MPQKRRFQQLFDQINAEGGASRSDCLRVFSLARELAESQESLKSYPTLRFFADWSLHPKLNRASAKYLLKRIEIIIDKYRDSPPDNIVREISQALSINALHDDLSKLLSTENLPIFMLNQPQPWTQVVSWLIQDILEKPVIGSKFTEEEEETGWGSKPRELRLTAKGEGSPVMWEVKLGPRVIIRGHLIKG